VGEVPLLGKLQRQHGPAPLRRRFRLSRVERNVTELDGGESTLTKSHHERPRARVEEQGRSGRSRCKQNEGEMRVLTPVFLSRQKTRRLVLGPSPLGRKGRNEKKGQGG